MNIEDIIHKIKDRIPRPLEIENRYAVLIPLIRIQDRWEIIYELRSQNLKRQPGEVSFPGGGVERGESYKEAAIRETMEELNIKKENIELIDELDYLVSYSNTTIHSFLAIIHDVNIDEIEPNREEVDHIFTVPLEFFMENEPKLYFIDIEATISKDFPYYLIPNGKDYEWKFGRHSVYFYKYDKYTIWGYTAKMTKCFVDIIRFNEIKD